VIIHIGVPKTGSTSIQKFLYTNKDIFSEIGFEDGTTFANDDNNPDYWAHHLLAHKWGGWMDIKKAPVSPEQAWENLRQEVLLDDKRTILISSERFADLFASSNAENILDYIISSLYPANVKILVYIRNQHSLLESFYKQQVKVGMKVPPINVYIKKMIPEFLDFYKMLETCSKFIGRENIIVRSYENELKENSNIIHSFIKACGFDCPSGVVFDSKKYNTSLSTLSAAILSNPDLRKMRQRKKYVYAIRS